MTGHPGIRALRNGFYEEGKVLSDLGDSSFFGEDAKGEGELGGEGVEEVHISAEGFFAEHGGELIGERATSWTSWSSSGDYMRLIKARYYILSRHQKMF